ncbi:hypothetical protein CUS_4938 [Ruminococcus albus 8]|uniref:Uncharacterized protein n=1 Tax=Ruminococcus albus 8 TaxID=246199 RepID=E9S7L3_RUMAL|nr:hypothetical protein CUS_4938 [Ruminococcus albus 8]
MHWAENRLDAEIGQVFGRGRMFSCEWLIKTNNTDISLSPDMGKAGVCGHADLAI